jgi:TonB family protein
MRVPAVALIAAVLPASALAQRNDCKATKTPNRLPPASALVDSAAALDALASIEAPDGMMFSVVFPDGDSLPHVRPLFETDPAATAILARWMRPQRPGQVWAVRVRVAQGPPASLQLERAVYCPPVVIAESRSRQSTSVRVQASDQPRINAMGRGTVEIEVDVSEDGLPITVNLIQPSGVGELDDQIVDGWRATRFQPALIDGVRVRGRYKTGGKSPRL